jgi:hypothetical protein
MLCFTVRIVRSFEKRKATLRENMMMKLVSTEKSTFFGALVLGIAWSTLALAQPIPEEVASKQNAVGIKADSVEQSIQAILLRCDKCDPAVKNEINSAKKDFAGLKQLINDLRRAVDVHFAAVLKACK